MRILLRLRPACHLGARDHADRCVVRGDAYSTQTLLTKKMRLLRITLWQLSATRARSGGVAWGWVGRRFGHPAFCLCGDFVPRATSFAPHKRSEERRAGR